MPRHRLPLPCRRTLSALALALLALAPGASAQSTWQPAGAIEGGTVRRLSRQTGRLWAATQGGVYRSDDGAASWVHVLPEGLAAVADPADPESALATADDGTVLFTRDGGRTWRPSDLFIGPMHFAFAPSRPSQVYAWRDADVYCSHDRGVSWQGLAWTGFYNARDLAVAARHPLLLHVAAREGLFRSTDGGLTWSQVGAVGEGSFARVAIDPAHPRRVYAVAERGVVWRSDDLGASWSRLADLGEDRRLTAFAVDPDAPEVLYLGTQTYLDSGATEPSARPGRLLRSADGGRTWAEALETEVVRDIVVEPGAGGGGPRRAWLATDALGVWRSADAGVTWNPANVGLHASELRWLLPAAQGGALYVVPVARRADFSSDRSLGVWKSLDEGRTWAPANSGLTGPAGGFPDLTQLVADPARDGTLYAGTIDGRLFKTSDGGIAWRQILARPELVDIRQIALDPRDSRTVYAVGSAPDRGDSPVLKSADGGETWTALPGPSGLLWGILVDLWDPGALYVSGTNGLYRSRDGGRSWIEVVTSALVPSSLVSGSTPGAFAGLDFDTLLDSFDRGRTWELGRLQGIDFLIGIHTLFRAPQPASPVYAAGDFGVFRLNPYAGIWRRIGGAPPFSPTAVAADPLRPGKIYAGSRDGQVFVLRPPS
ncbi:MAG TPA: hypothetical protein VHU81_01640 [Thermoanaerobaculia bacterium]|nr:hypothetical protein [Thermoanaerobaculia bacterium]